MIVWGTTVPNFVKLAGRTRADDDEDMAMMPGPASKSTKSFPLESFSSCCLLLRLMPNTQKHPQQHSASRRSKIHSHMNLAPTPSSPTVGECVGDDEGDMKNVG